MLRLCVLLVLVATVVVTGLEKNEDEKESETKYVRFLCLNI
jgi:hypothetical protein